MQAPKTAQLTSCRRSSCVLPSSIATMFVRAGYVLTRCMYTSVLCRGKEYGVSADSITSEEYLLGEEFSSGDILLQGDPKLIFDKADSLLERSSACQEEAYSLLKSVENKYGNNPDYLWRLAQATYLKSRIVGERGDIQQKKSLVYSSEKIASKALQMQADNPNVHKWCAVTSGSVGDYESPRVKIENAFKFKEHIEKAIELSPTDASAHYLLGRWCYGVSMLSWVERKAASVLISSPPTSTIDEALEHFLKADRLQPGNWKANLLHIAKCYIEKQDYPKALSYLDKAEAAPAIGQDSANADTEVRNLLSKYSCYR